MTIPPAQATHQKADSLVTPPPANLLVNELQPRRIYLPPTTQVERGDVTTGRR